VYETLLALHILSAIVFVGNIITAAYWKVRADRSGNLAAMASTSRLVMQADYFFTFPGVIGLLVTGFLMVAQTGWDRFQEPWLGAAVGLLLLTMVISAVAVVPSQRRMVRTSQEALTSGVLSPEYERASRRWAIFGGIATLIPVIILFLMVLKPGA
jgi:uncharacterized membrane protein